MPRNPRPPRRSRLNDLFDSLLDGPIDALDKSMDSLDDILDDGDKTLDKAMSKLDKKMEELDRKLQNLGTKKKKHSMSFKDARGNKVKVEYNDADDLSIQTNGDMDKRLMKEIRERIKKGPVAPKKPTPPPMRTDPPSVRRTRSRAIPTFFSRTLMGDSGTPLVFNAESRVEVSSGGMFNRKYTVKVDGTPVYMKLIESMLKDSLVKEHFVDTMTDDEKAIMRKILEGLDKLGIAESHHTYTAHRLNR